MVVAMMSAINYVSQKVNSMEILWLGVFTLSLLWMRNDWLSGIVIV